MERLGTRTQAMLLGLLATLCLILCPVMAQGTNGTGEDTATASNESTNESASASASQQNDRQSQSSQSGEKGNLLLTGSELYGPTVTLLSVTAIISAGLAMVFAVKYKNSAGK